MNLIAMNLTNTAQIIPAIRGANKYAGRYLILRGSFSFLTIALKVVAQNPIVELKVPPVIL